MINATTYNPKKEKENLLATSIAKLNPTATKQLSSPVVANTSINSTVNSTAPAVITTPPPTTGSTSSILIQEQKDALVNAGLMKSYLSQNKGWGDLAETDIQSLLTQLDTKTGITPTTVPTTPPVTTTTPTLTREQKDALVDGGHMKDYAGKNWSDLSETEVQSLLGKLNTNTTTTPATIETAPTLESNDNVLAAIISQMQSGLQPTDYKQMFTDIMGMLPQFEQPKTLSWEDALSRAGDSLNPIYDKRMESLTKNLDMSNLSRGFYGQLPGEALKLENMTEEEQGRLSSISDFANQLIGRSEAEASQLQQMNMAKENQALGLIQNALSYADGTKQNNINNLTSLWDMYNSTEDKERKQQIENAILQRDGTRWDWEQEDRTTNKDMESTQWEWAKEDRDWVVSDRLAEQERNNMIWNWTVEDRNTKLNQDQQDREYEIEVRNIVKEMQKLEYEIASNPNYGMKAEAEKKKKLWEEELKKAKAWQSTGTTKNDEVTVSDVITGIYDAVYSMNPKKAYDALNNPNSTLRKDILTQLSQIGHKDAMSFLNDLTKDLESMIFDEYGDIKSIYK